MPANNPANTRHGGVGIFYKNSLPVVVRKGLCFDESIVIELQLGRKKYFLLFCIQALPLITSLLIFKPVCLILEIYMWISKQKIIFHHFLLEILMLTPSFGDLVETQLVKARKLNISWHHRPGLSQVMSESTNFEPNKTPSYIDQPNLILDSGTRDSLDPYCHLQIIYCEVNFRIHPPPSLDRKILVERIQLPLNEVWPVFHGINTDNNWQVKTFTDIFLNIMSNYIPNETKRFVPCDPPWITKPLKTMLNRNIVIRKRIRLSLTLFVLNVKKQLKLPN